MTDAEYIAALVVRADAWLGEPGRNMLNETDDLILRLTQVARAAHQILQAQGVIVPVLNAEVLDADWVRSVLKTRHIEVE